MNYFDPVSTILQTVTDKDKDLKSLQRPIYP